MIPAPLSRARFFPCLVAAFAAALWLVAAVPAAAQGRVALVLGNGAYEVVPPLENPVNDAEDISAALRELGFEVFTGIDQTLVETDQLIDRFREAAAGAEVALFYYAGHAFQVAGRNYLIPTDLRPASPSDVVGQTLPLDRVMTALQEADGLRLIFLDACRDNPLGVEVAGGVESGLARIGSSADYFISFATQPGAVAFDGDGRNGTFTEAVLSYIHNPAQTLTDMMIAVRRDVIAASGGQQIPWENSSLTRQFAFREGTRTASPETLFYQVAARAGDVNLMQLYLDRYPDGAHVTDAATFVEARLTGQDLPAAAGTGGRSLEEVDPDGNQLWLLIQRTRMRRLAEYYIDLYPNGAHRDAAERLLTVLPSETELGDGRLCEQLATHPRDSTANTAGVPFSRLERNASLAIEVCTNATAEFPDQPKYVALLARAKAAAGQREDAVRLYRDAAGRGDLRAQVSLGLLMETGDGVPRDPVGAVALYEQAAQGGSADGAINLAVALFNGSVVARDEARAIALFRQASEAGSAIATYNLGVLTQQGAVGETRDALELFRQAAWNGEPRGYLAAAILLDEGRGVDRDATAAADMLLRGAAADNGQVLAQLTQGADGWTSETIRAVQGRLQEAGFYEGAIDGIPGPAFTRALKLWRNGGFDAGVLGG